MNYFVFPGLRKRPALSPQEVLELVSSFTGVSTKQMLKRGRKREVVMARQIVAWLLRTKLKLTIVQIARVLYPGTTDNRNSVHNLLHTHNDLMETDDEYRTLVDNIYHSTTRLQ